MGLGTKLRKLREKKGWSQMDVAHQLDISQSAYNKWEAEQTKPTLPHLQKLAEIFEVDFFDLVQTQVPNVDLSNAKFENSSCLVFDSTINFQSKEIVDKIFENQLAITTLLENQNKLLEAIIKKK